MGERLFGVETEYAFTALGAGGTLVDSAIATSRFLGIARQTLPHLDDGYSIGLFLENGARLYVDTGRHPEFSTPECTDPWDGVRYVRAGDRIMERVAAELVARSRDIRDVLVWRGNVDYTGTQATWGCHESYLFRGDRDLLCRHIMPHLVSRVVYTGAGGFNNLSKGIEFTLSPRVAHLNRGVSGESTHHRGIFHTKGETLAGHDYQRLHLLCGESVCSETAAWLKLGTTALIVAMVDAGLSPGDAVQPRSPLDAIRTFARDPTCRATVPAIDGRRLDALDIQHHYLDEAERHVDDAFMPPWAGDVCRRWRAALERLEGAPASVSSVLDWAIKLPLFRDRAARRGLAWDSLPHWTLIAMQVMAALAKVEHKGKIRPEKLIGRTSPIPDVIEALTPTLRKHGLLWDGFAPFLELRQELFEIDVRFSQLGDSGIFGALDRAGVLTHHIAGVEGIDDAVKRPPSSCRARLRGEAIRELAARGGAATADWQWVCDQVTQRRLDLTDPFATSPQWTSYAESPESKDTLDLLMRMRQRVERLWEGR